MAGINPALLAHLSGAPHAAPPGATAAAAAPSAPAEKPEPVALHDASNALLSAIQAAKSQADDLQSQAELADKMDPAAEKAVAQVAAFLGQALETITKAESMLGDARKEHDEATGGAGDDDADNAPAP